MALVITVDAHDTIRPLENPANDARAIEDLPERLDFEGFDLTNRDPRRTRRALLTDAAEIDAASRSTLRDGLVSRAVSAAQTQRLHANAARADLRYDLAIQDLRHAVTLYAGLAPGDRDGDTQFDHVTALSDLGGLHLVAGNTRTALDTHFPRSKFAQSRVEADPADVGWVRELIWSLNAYGTVLQQQGYLTEAEAALASALKFSQWPADQRPHDIDLKRSRRVSRNRLGEVRYARNDFAGALAAHDRSRARREGIVALDPQNRPRQRDLGVAIEPMGDVRLAMGDRTGARTLFETALALRRSLLAADPGGTQYRRDVTFLLLRLGDLHTEAGDHAAAPPSYAQSVALRADLAAAAPPDVPTLRDLMIIQNRHAATLLARERHGDAVQAARRSLRTVERRLHLDPDVPAQPCARWWPTAAGFQSLTPAAPAGPSGWAWRGNGWAMRRPPRAIWPAP